MRRHRHGIWKTDRQRDEASHVQTVQGLPGPGEVHEGQTLRQEGLIVPWSVPRRYKLYALVATAFVMGLLRWRNAAVERAITNVRSEQQRARDKALRTARGVRDEVKLLDDVGLAERASRWVRNRDD
jgi:hypothetical protein